MKKRFFSKTRNRVLALGMSVVLVGTGLNLTSLSQNVLAGDLATLEESKVMGLSFEDSLTDSKGTVTPTVVGTEQYTTGIKDGKAFKFNGSTFLNLGKSTDLQPSNLTVSFWLKAESTMVGEQIICWNKAEWNTNGWYVSSLNDTTPIVLSAGDAPEHPVEYQVSASRSEFFPVGEWVNVVITYDSDNKIGKIYRNGVEQTTTVYNKDISTQVIKSSDCTKTIGSNGYAHGNGGNPTIDLDEYELYSVAADAAQAQALYNKNSEVTVDTVPDLKGMSEFNIEDVIMDDEYEVESLNLDVNYLKELDADKLLAGFRETAGLDMKGATRYEGWENSLIGGHTIGHYMTAVAQACVNPNVSAADKTTLTDKLNYIVDALLECQNNTKGKAGFIFGSTIVNSGNVEKQFDNVESNATNITTQSWVPWYTMHKIIAGLVSVYELTGYENAKTVASGLGDWTYNRASSWSEAKRNTVLGIEYGGMNDCLYELYTITNKANHLTAAAYFDETTLFESVLAGGKNVLNNKHANTTIPKFLGALNRYKVTGEEKYLQYAEAFWTMVIDNHTYITGGNSEWEHFGEDNVLDDERTNCNCETCNSYNMLKLSRELFKITGEKKYSDYYETTFINSILSSQNSETGMSTYFQPMATGYFKVYGEKFNKFWCCTGSGMENFTKLGDSIYFYKDNTLFVNQYVSSTLNWTDENVTVKQETSIPNTNTSKFTVTTGDGSSADVNIRLRLPDWLADSATIKVNGNDYKYSTKAGYALVSGSLTSGTVIEITLPMEVKAYTLPDNDSAYAFKYGPIVLSADLGTDTLTTTTTGVSVTIPAIKKTSSENILVNMSIGTVSDYIANINKYLVKTDGKLEFTMTGTDSDLVFSPHYSKNSERYGIYWYLSDDTNGMQEAIILAGKNEKRNQRTLLDTVQPGYGQYENDALHEMVENNSVGVTDDGTYRYAQAGGNFAYDMIVDPTVDNVLECTFRKADNGKHIKISIGSKVLFDGTLNYDGEEDSYTVAYTIPKDVVNAQKTVKTVEGAEVTVANVKFEASATAESAKVCNFIYMRRAYSDTNSLVSLTSETGTVVKADDGTYSLTIPKNSASFGLNMELADTNGYARINGIAVDDSKAVTTAINAKKVVYTIRVYAEDFETYKDYTLTVKVLYDIDNNLAYFVDCGDHNTNTVSDGDAFGTHNSVTEQAYGTDKTTGYKWGIVDNPEDLQGGSANSAAVYTANTWAFEFETADNQPKETTNRYTKNQYETGVTPRFLDYAFELENGTYEVEVGFADPWSVSNSPTVYANYEKASQSTVVEKLNLNSSKTAKATVTVTDGELTLNVRSTALCINMSYIKIYALNSTGNLDDDKNQTTEDQTTVDENTNNGNSDTPQTGDYKTTMIILTLMVSFSAMAFLAVKKKKIKIITSK